MLLLAELFLEAAHLVHTHAAALAASLGGDCMKVEGPMLDGMRCKQDSRFRFKFFQSSLFRLNVYEAWLTGKGGKAVRAGASLSGWVCASVGAIREAQPFSMRVGASDLLYLPPAVHPVTTPASHLPPAPRCFPGPSGGALPRRSASASSLPPRARPLADS